MTALNEKWKNGEQIVSESWKDSEEMITGYWKNYEMFCSGEVIREYEKCQLASFSCKRWERERYWRGIKSFSLQSKILLSL